MELKPVPSPDGFCQRVEQPPGVPVGRIGSRQWADWLTHVVGNYDCTCPGGRYYGKNLEICKGVP